MKTYTAIILTLILITLMGATYLMYMSLQQDRKVTEPKPNELTVVNEQSTMSNNMKKVEPIVASKVTGKLCYPSEMLPPMDIYLKNVETQVASNLQTLANQQTYSFDNVQPGKYVAFAYLQTEGDLGGGYTSAVPCGLSVNCTDHSLIEFTVVEGADFEDVDICDWYGAELPAKP